MFAARNGKKFQEISSLEELGKTEQNLRGSYKVIGNCERKFKAWIDHSIKNTILREATKQAENKCSTKYLKDQEEKELQKKYREYQNIALNKTLLFSFNKTNVINDCCILK